MQPNITKKIRLRKPKKSDWPYFLKWWNDKKLIALTSGMEEKDKNVLTGWFSDMLNSKKDHHYIILFEKKVVGHIFLAHRSKKVCEVNIVIGEKRYWGKDIGAAAIKEALKIGFNELGYSECYLEVRPENKRAISAYKKCGFKEAGFKNYPTNGYRPRTLTMTIKAGN